ncbi:MAG: ABC transporter substrate-binding protein [Candidatus Promineifilaceae bacterium]
MDDQFDWQFDESKDERPSSHSFRRSLSPLRNFEITAAFITIFIVGGWAFLHRREERYTQMLVEAAQSTLDMMSAAVLDGDGEIFFALQEPGPEMFAAQLTASTLDFFRARPTISNIEQSGTLLHANTVWEENGQAYQRVLFFSHEGNRIQQTASDPVYWGAEKQLKTSWGQLAYLERDELWAGEIANFAADEIKNLCSASCQERKLPLTLKIGSGYVPTAEPGHIQLSSPRLLGLDEAGRPSDRFWQLLEQYLTDYLTPTTIRFAVPSDPFCDVEPCYFQRIDYEAAAEIFMAENPDIQVELVTIESLPPQPQELLAYDGAAFTPTIEMIAAGRVVDLTPFMQSDPDFDHADFYEQIWQGAVWQEHLWMMPQAARIPLIYYHRSAFQSIEQEEPLIGWTWSEMEEDAANLVGAQILTGDLLTWGLLDQSFNILYAFAFHNQNQCPVFESRPCPLSLQDEDIAAALDWYIRLTGEEKVIPDASVLPREKRERLLINSLFKTAIWVDEPLYYEHRTAMFPMGIVPFPGSDQFDSNTPLWVMGSFISQDSERPLATWQWLKFLSSWPPMAHYRLVPARSSVSQETNFWTRLPRELTEPMRAAFPFARPVHLDERAIFSWPTIRAVVQGELTPQQAAQEGQKFSWFRE